MDLVRMVQQQQLRLDVPEFRPGDTVRVHVKVIEGGRERVRELVLPLHYADLADLIEALDALAAEYRGQSPI